MIVNNPASSQVEKMEAQQELDEVIETEMQEQKERFDAALIDPISIDLLTKGENKVEKTLTENYSQYGFKFLEGRADFKDTVTISADPMWRATKDNPKPEFDPNLDQRTFDFTVKSTRSLESVSKDMSDWMNKTKVDAATELGNIMNLSTGIDFTKISNYNLELKERWEKAAFNIENLPGKIQQLEFKERLINFTKWRGPEDGHPDFQTVKKETGELVILDKNTGKEYSFEEVQELLGGVVGPVSNLGKTFRPNMFQLKEPDWDQSTAIVSTR